MKKEFYTLLNIPEDATEAQIKKAYRTLSKKYHPDKSKDDPWAETMFIRIAKAYKVLIDTEKRKYYDKTGNIKPKREEYSKEQEEARVHAFIATNFTSLAMHANFPKTDNLIELFKEHVIAGELIKFDVIIKTGNVAIEKLTEVKNRIEVKKGKPNPLKMHIESTIQHEKENLKNINIQKVYIKKAEKIINNYTYKTDAKVNTPTASFVITAQGFGNATTG